jgi:class 3 adenylate cyclase/tetratricopeptide (TPR) repeat protein
MNEAQRAQQSTADGQFRHATVLFLDLSGYSELVARMRGDLEAVDRMSDMLEQVAHRIVSKHRGIVNEVRGDGVVALFGLPGHGEFDVRDAVDAALELHRTVQQLSDSGALGGMGSLMLHSGIHSGLVLVRRATRDNRLYRVTGDAMIVAARLSDAATPGEVVVSASSLEGVGEFFETRPREHLDIPTIGAVSTVSVTRRSPVRRPFDARLRRRLSPFIGRQHALHSLDTLFDATVKGGVHLAGIVGMAGVGKTRLAEEALSRTYAANVRVLRGHCSGLRQSTPLEPFLEILRDVLEVDELAFEDRPTQVSARLAARLPTLSAHADTLLELLSLDEADADATPADESRGRAMVEALVAMLLSLAERQVLVLFLDDWQWADESSGQVVAALKARADAARIMLLIASRERGLGGGIDAPQVKIELEGLKALEVSAVVKALLPDAPNLGHIESIFRQTGGVPLYIEELCQAGNLLVLEHDGQAAQPLEGVPHWLARLIESRFDRLSEAAQEVASLAATIGTVVPAWLLENLAGSAPDEQLLAELADAGLLYTDGPREPIHFKHGITRDVIYSLLGLERRRGLHLRAAKAIETEIAPEQREEYFEALAYHHRCAESLDEAVEYAVLAADKARVRAALDSARLHYQAALDLLDRLEQGPATEARRSALCRHWALVCMYGPAAGQVERFKQQVAYALEIGDEEAAARGRYFVGYLCYTLGRHNDARTELMLAYQLASRLNMGNLCAEIVGALGHSASARGDNSEALAHLDGALELWSAEPSPRGLPVGQAYTLSCKGMISADLGDFDGGLTLISRGLTLVRDSNHQIEGSIRCFHSAVLMWTERWADALAAAEAARRVGQRVNGPYIFAMASAMSAYARWKLDANPRHVDALGRAVEWLEGWGIGLYLSLVYGWMVEALADSGRYAEAAAIYRRSVEQRGAEGEHLGSAVAARALARAAARARPPCLSNAEHYLECARDFAARLGSPVQAACNALCAAEVFHLKGDIAAARAALSQACVEFERLKLDIPLRAARAMEPVINTGNCAAAV